MNIQQFTFNETMGRKDIIHLQQLLPVFNYTSLEDDCIAENSSFTYDIYIPDSVKQPASSGILLLHGLNERSWKKYDSWARQLAERSGVPVVLFPLAFHMNRTPSSWCNPRKIVDWLKNGCKQQERAENTTFANAVLSSRLVDSPLRFYVSGKESAYNVWQLLTDINAGSHPVFAAGTHLNIFAYSIGAFLSEIMMIANPDGLLSDSKLFIFMGGSVINGMYGSARDIMDQTAYEQMQHFYRHLFGFGTDEPYLEGGDIERAFMMMLNTDRMKEEREKAFRQLQDRLRIITMRKDRVIPTESVFQTLGITNQGMLQEEDFPFDYSHQVPFPTSNPHLLEVVTASLNRIFEQATDFMYRGSGAFNTVGIRPC